MFCKVAIFKMCHIYFSKYIDNNGLSSNDFDLNIVKIMILSDLQKVLARAHCYSFKSY